MVHAKITGTDIRHLRYGEHLLIWLLRACVACPGNCRVVLSEFHLAFGPKAEEATDALEALLLALSKGRRRLDLAAPGQAFLNHDELLLLAMFEAAQGEDDAAFCAHARFILGHDGTSDLWQACVPLTALLTCQGYGLRKVSAPVPEPYERLQALRFQPAFAVLRNTM